MSERKPSEMWVEREHYWSLATSFTKAVVLKPSGEFAPYCSVSTPGYAVKDGVFDTVDAAKFAAEDVLLSIAREIREAVGRD